MRSLKLRALVLILFLAMLLPVHVHAAGRVKVKYHGVTRSYSGKMTSVYINGKKKSIKANPVFMKDGAYVGPVVQLFVNSAFKAAYKKSGNKITLTYKSKKLVLKDNSRNAVVNGVTQKNVLGASPMRAARYSSSGASRWIVPLKSVCLRLGIPYQVKNSIVYLGTAKTSSSTKASSTTSAKTTVAAAADDQAAQASTNQTVSGKKQVVLVMDAGHGGVDSGAIGALYKEKTLTLAIVLAAKKYFDNDTRFKVYYTRTSDTYPSLSDRSKLANNNHADLFICVHINSAGSTATGTETLYNNSRLASTKKNGITSKVLAQAMQTAAVKSTGLTNRGLVNRTGLWVLNHTNMPACLIEYGFISNKTEEKKLHANTGKYGKDLYQALVDFSKTKGLIE